MAGKTTNLQLQKIDDTDYAGNFPTIYNNNLDLIDILNNKQDKLIAGSGITIAADGKTISSSGKEYTAGSGITIDDSGVISTTVPIGTYNTPLMASAHCSNDSLLIRTSFGYNVSLYPTILTRKSGDTISTSYSGEKSLGFPTLLFANSDTGTSVDITIDLIPVIGLKSKNNCTIYTMLNKNNTYNRTDALVNSQPITGTISNGIFNGSFISYKMTGSQTRYYGIGVKDGTTSTNTFTILIDSISIL